MRIGDDIKPFNYFLEPFRKEKQMALTDEGGSPFTMPVAPMYGGGGGFGGFGNGDWAW